MKVKKTTNRLVLLVVSIFSFLFWMLPLAGDGYLEIYKLFRI